MRRTISGFHVDALGDWVAELSCLHQQHVRHRPPFQDRTWVTSEAGRAGRIGAFIECVSCDRAELPEGLRVVRTAGPFDATTLPPGLRRAHRVAEGTWGLVRVLEGDAVLSLATEPPVRARLAAGDSHPLPPGVLHEVSLGAGGRLAVDFLAGKALAPAPPSLVHLAAGDAAALRRRVLYRHAPEATGTYPQDSLSGAIHLGLTGEAGDLVAAASWYPETTPLRAARAPYRLRGMAVEERHQGRGLGRALFEAGLAALRERGADLLWANARDDAIGFYERLGMTVAGPGFLAAGGIPHHVVVLDLGVAGRPVPG